MWVRLATYLYSGLLIVAMYASVMSNARPGTMTWGPAVDFWASSIAISHIEYGLGGGLGYRTITSEFAKRIDTEAFRSDKASEVQPEKVEAAFQAVSRLPKSAMQDGPIEDAVYVTTWAEDIGYADFYEIAFRFFGYHALSTYWLFFSILAVSFVLFAAAYWDDDVATSALAVAVAAAFLTGTTNIFSYLLPSFAANRYLEILTVLPCLHLLMAGMRERPFTGIRLVLIVAQALLYALTITFRTSAIWTLIAAITVLVAFVGIKRFRAREDLATRSWQQFTGAIFKSREILFAGVIAFSGMGLPYLRDTQLDPIYLNEALPHHLRWHPAILGLSLHPLWPQKKPSANVPDALSDEIGFTLFENYMRQNHPGEPLTSSKTRGAYLPRLHDAVMKQELIGFARANPGYMVELYGYYKPKLILSQITENLRTVPLAAWLLCLPTLLLGFLLGTGVTINFLAMTGAAFIVWLSAQLPALWAYPANYVAVSRMWTTFLLIAILVLAALVKGSQIVALVLARSQASRSSEALERV
jgi:hypothetical protein